MLAFALIPVSLVALVSARLHHSRVPDDPYAFPKFRVTFLNGLPILNETVQRWMQDGLRGGDAEFMDQPWDHELWQSSPFKSIDGAEGQQVLAQPKFSPNHTLELMKFGSHDYVCLIPPPPEEPTPPPEEDPSHEVTPGHTWSLLQPLAGTCLYHRHGWFTYSYCHNSHVRQFRELVPPAERRTTDWKPEEDPEWEAYTLGRAPPTLDPGADLTVAEEAAIAANVELARGVGSRYLVQRWGDGTLCDKTGRKREIEVQFHCSMTTPDSIVFIKETSTCHYVLHIATPRICGEPGFKTRLDAHEESLIRCREILDPSAYENADRTLPAADHPFRMPKRVRPPVIAPPPQGDAGKGKGKGAWQKPLAQLLEGRPDILRKALEKLMSESGELKTGTAAVVMEDGADGDEFVVEFVMDHDSDDGGDDDDDSDSGAETHSEGAAVANGETAKTKEKSKGEKQRSIPEMIELLRLQQKTLLDLKEKMGSSGQEKQQKESNGKNKQKKGTAGQRDRVDARGGRHADP